MILQQKHISQSTSQYGTGNSNFESLVFADAPYQLDVILEIDMIKMTESSNDFLFKTILKYHSSTMKLLNGDICYRYSISKNVYPNISNKEYLQSVIRELFDSQFENLKQALFSHDTSPVHDRVQKELRENEYYLQKIYETEAIQDLLKEYDFRITYWNTKH